MANMRARKVEKQQGPEFHHSKRSRAEVPSAPLRDWCQYAAFDGERDRVNLAIYGTSLSIEPPDPVYSRRGSLFTRNSGADTFSRPQSKQYDRPPSSLNSAVRSIHWPRNPAPPLRFRSAPSLGTIPMKAPSPFSSCPTSRSHTSIGSSAFTYPTTTPKSRTVRASGFKMATLSKVAGSAVSPFTENSVGMFQDTVVGQKLNLPSSFLGPHLRVKAATCERSQSRLASRRSSRPGSVFCAVASSTGQPSVQQPQAVASTSNGKTIECYGVSCMTYDLKEGERPKTWKKTVRIAVSGAAGAISNHLLFKLASGEVFGQDQPIALNLLGCTRSRDALEGLAMELEDSLFPLLREVNIGIEAREVFGGCDWALLLDSKPQDPGMEHTDLLDVNGEIFSEQGKALNEVASPNVKVMVVGNPRNTNALVAMKNAPRIPAKNFHALTRLDENRAKCQLALKARVFYDNVSNVIIWGNHSTTQVPDFLNAKIHGMPVKDVITDHKWLEEEFTPRVQTRGGALINKWGHSSAASTAVSIADAIKSLVTPTPEGDWFSSGVYTMGNPYGIAEDIVFSMPCRSKGDGDYELVPNVLIDNYLYQRIKKIYPRTKMS